MAADLPSGPGGALSAERQRTRARLLKAARIVFERDGFRRSRITDIAHLGGLAHGGFYRYFDSKETVFLELVEAAAERLGTPLDGVAFDSDPLEDLPDRMRSSIRRYLETYQDGARILGLIRETGHENDRLRVLWRDPRRPDVERHVEAVRQLQLRGLIETRVSPLVMVFGVIGMLERFADRWLVDGAITCDLDVAVEQLARLSLQALRIPDRPG
ncbi:TetR/AcrR family transcriptional regulator [Frankia sp. AgB1.9]|nr:TetR/AcrR family transcriptional regulator [Frankia sp. AgW1.1]MBL7547276.1 TetR/AcrR family transcriptional regulator [Frankia sp. AgB1.9]MBL7620819.1 TetR/AcrR family transcriptional regulator [Frankia sp. AgB1.8]